MSIPVLLAVRELGLGGIERDVCKLALHMDRTRYIPYVAAYKPRGPRFEELQEAGVPVLHLDVNSLLSASALRAASQLRSFIKERGIRVVHAFDPISVFTNPLAKAFGVPVVLASQLGRRDLNDARTQSRLRNTDRFSDIIVVNCEALRRHLIQEHAIKPERIEICYNGVDTGIFFPGPGEHIPELGDASLVAGTVAVLRPEKALHEFVEAFAHAKSAKSGAKLLIVGTGPELERIERARDEHGLNADCVLLPARRDVAPILRRMDIFVSCSHNEAFSNAILEAMACGACVVGSKVGGTPELLGEGRGLLFEPGNIPDFASKLQQAMQNDTLRHEVGNAAARHARENLNLHKNVQRTMEIYDMLFSRKGLREAK